MKRILFVLAFAGAFPAFASDLWEGYDHYEVAAPSGHLNCRKEPSGTAAVLVRLDAGRTLWVERVVQDQRGKPWFLVPGGETGVGNCYVRANTEYLRPLTQAGDLFDVSGGAFKVVDGTGLNCRLAPEVQSPVVQWYAYGQFLGCVEVVLAENGKPWFRTSEGCFVRANGKYLSEVQYD